MRLQEDASLAVAPVVDEGAAVALHRDAAQRDLVAPHQVGDDRAGLAADRRAQHRTRAERSRHATDPVALTPGVQVHLDLAVGVAFELDEEHERGREDREVGRVGHAPALPARPNVQTDEPIRMAPMLLADLVATATAVGSTRSRLAKVDAIATLLGSLAPEEIVDATGLPRRRSAAGPHRHRMGHDPRPRRHAGDRTVDHDRRRVARGRRGPRRAPAPVRCAPRRDDPRSVVRAGHRTGEPTSSAACSSASCGRARSKA